MRACGALTEANPLVSSVVCSFITWFLAGRYEKGAEGCQDTQGQRQICRSSGPGKLVLLLAAG